LKRNKKKWNYPNIVSCDFVGIQSKNCFCQLSTYEKDMSSDDENEKNGKEK
jgi:hypothetical protein